MQNRQQMIEKLQKIVTNDQAIIIENSVHNFLNEYSVQKNINNISIQKKLYKAKIQQMYHLFDKKSYININVNDLLNDKEKLKNIAFIPYQNICKTKWNLLEPDLKVLDAKITDKTQNVYTTNTFTCYVCHQNKCIYSEVQVRSCDENATIFVRCLNCGNCFRG